ncbi:MAG: hypothetical protein AAF581_02965 [Planctomycetota bacterium]
MNRQFTARAIGCGLALTFMYLALPAATYANNAALQRLQEAYPGVRVLRLEDRMAIYGKPMTRAATPDAAAAAWLANHSQTFGVPGLDLRLRRSYDLLGNGLVVYHYEQWIGTTAVEYGAARIAVRPGPDAAAVVYAAATLAEIHDEALAPIRISSDQASAIVAKHRFFGNLEEYSTPQLSIIKSSPVLDSEGAPLPRRTWRLTGSDSSLTQPRAFTFHIDAETGALLEARSEIHNLDVSGTVSGLASPGDRPDTAANPPVSVPLASAEVAIGATTAISDAAGAFTVPFGGTGAVNVDGVLRGPWVEVLTQQGTPVTTTLLATPPGPANLLLNDTPSEFTTAQVNAFVHVNQAHDFFAQRAPTFTDIDIPLPCTVNVPGSCNASFSSLSISLSFFAAGGGCENSSFSDIVQHEYGHFVVNRIGLAQGAFGEGFGDTLSLIFADDAQLAEDFGGPGTVGRDITGDNVQYPCPSTAIHFCGELLAGCWWDLRVALGASLGSAAGRDLAQQLFADWSQLTLGGSGFNSAHPMTAIEYMMVDDDDGNIDNGTPHRDDICLAFSNHSIDCPILPPILFEFPLGLPTMVSPAATTTVQVSIVETTGTLVPGSERVWWSLDGFNFTEGQLTALGSGLYEGTLPAAMQCGRYRYYFSADLLGGGTELSAPQLPHSLTVADGFTELLFDDMETDPGWTVGAPTDTATTGIWTRDDPIGTTAQPENDHTPTGTLCWFTGQGTPGGAQGENDVDGGPTTLVSPSIDATQGETRIQFYLMYANSTGNAPSSDVFQIEISNSGVLGQWIPALTLGPDVFSLLGVWQLYELWVSDYVTPTNTVHVRFRARDDAPGSIVEAALDDLRVEVVFCDSTPSFRRGDCNDDGGVQIADAVFLLSGLFGGVGLTPPCADACDGNDDGNLDIADAVLILAALFSGGGPLPDPGMDNCGADATTGDTLLECAGATCL